MKKKWKNIIIALISIGMLVLVARYLNLLDVLNTDYFQINYVYSGGTSVEPNLRTYELRPYTTEVFTVPYSSSVAYSIDNTRPFTDSGIPGVRLTDVPTLQIGKYFRGSISGTYDILENYNSQSQYITAHTQNLQVECKLDLGGYRLIGSPCSASNGCYCRYNSEGYITECDNGRYGVKQGIISCNVHGQIDSCESGNCALRLPAGYIIATVYNIGHSPQMCYATIQT